MDGFDFGGYDFGYGGYDYGYGGYDFGYSGFNYDYGYDPYSSYGYSGYSDPYSSYSGYDYGYDPYSSYGYSGYSDPYSSYSGYSDPTYASYDPNAGYTDPSYGYPDPAYASYNIVPTSYTSYNSGGTLNDVLFNSNPMGSTSGFDPSYTYSAPKPEVNADTLGQVEPAAIGAEVLWAPEATGIGSYLGYAAKNVGDALIQDQVFQQMGLPAPY